MKLHKLVRKSRSIRRFDERKLISRATLRSLAAIARFTPSAGNLQPLRCIISNTPTVNQRIFTTLSWARNLADWSGPKQGERPAAYIVILADRALSQWYPYDCGIAAQTIALAAAEAGLGACMVASIDRAALRQALSIDTRYEIPLVIALGKPGEKVLLRDAPAGSSVSYFRDGQDRHVVPKRTLGELIIREYLR